MPRIVALAAILVLGSATITFAAENQLLTNAPQPDVPVAAPAVQTVPDVTGQAYVFAKGTLEEQGFAWRVVGSVDGYSANTVVTQVPAAGTRVVDTGAPTVVLGLARNGRYIQQGEPEATSPYRGTRIRLPVAPTKARPIAAAAPVAAPAPKPAARLKPVAKPKTVAKPNAVAKPKRKPAAKPARKPMAKPKRKPVVKPKPRPTAKPAPRRVAKAPARPAAFLVAGAPKEPLDEVTLPERARRLERWLDAHRKPTNANVRHWLYQHEWVVTGARFGWFGGEEALRILIRADERVQKLWGVGAKSEAAARRALAQVAARSR